MDHKQEIQNLIDRFYKLISGRAGGPRNWVKFHALFFSGARLIPTRFIGDDNCHTTAYDIESYITMLEPVLQDKDFFESGYDYKIEIHGHMAQVFSRYKAGTDKDLVNIQKTGTNLVQLIHDGRGWRIMNMLWEDS